MDNNRVNPKIHDLEMNAYAYPNSVNKRLSIPVIHQPKEAFKKVI